MASRNWYCKVCDHYQWERLEKCDKCGALLPFIEERDAWPDEED